MKSWIYVQGKLIIAISAVNAEAAMELVSNEIDRINRKAGAAFGGDAFFRPESVGPIDVSRLKEVYAGTAITLSP